MTRRDHRPASEDSRVSLNSNDAVIGAMILHYPFVEGLGDGGSEARV
jgi:hypothetical protein